MNDIVTFSDTVTEMKMFLEILITNVRILRDYRREGNRTMYLTWMWLFVFGKGSFFYSDIRTVTQFHNNPN